MIESETKFTQNLFSVFQFYESEKIEINNISLSQLHLIHHVLFDLTSDSITIHGITTENSVYISSILHYSGSLTMENCIFTFSEEIIIEKEDSILIFTELNDQYNSTFSDITFSSLRRHYVTLFSLNGNCYLTDIQLFDITCYYFFIFTNINSVISTIQFNSLTIENSRSELSFFDINSNYQVEITNSNFTNLNSGSNVFLLASNDQVNLTVKGSSFDQMPISK